MRRIFILLPLLMAFMSQRGPASPADSLFRLGNQYFQQGHYDQAIDAYQKVVDAGWESGELYYNLGNAYFKKGRWGMARLYYERALRFIPDDEALKENLALLEQRLVDKIEKPPRFFLSAWWKAVLDSFSFTALTWFSVLLFWLFLAACSFYLYQKKQKKVQRGRFLLWVSLFLFLLSSLILIDKAYRFETERYGVILEPSVTVYAEPRQKATELFVIHEGTKFRIMRENQQWIEIKLEDGKTGWVLGKTLATI